MDFREKWKIWRKDRRKWRRVATRVRRPRVRHRCVARNGARKCVRRSRRTFARKVRFPKLLIKRQIDRETRLQTSFKPNLKRSILEKSAPRPNTINSYLVDDWSCDEIFLIKLQFIIARYYSITNPLNFIPSFNT